MTSRSTIGLVGFGLMGEVYAGRLIAAGFPVIAYDVDPAKAERDKSEPRAAEGRHNWQGPNARED